MEGPHGNFILAPGAWLEIGDNAVQGNLELHAKLDDTRPASRALGMLIPDLMSLAGPLSIRAVADGKISLDSRKDLHERLANLKASFKLTLEEAQWRQEPFKDIVADLDLADGRLIVTKLGAMVERDA